MIGFLQKKTQENPTVKNREDPRSTLVSTWFEEWTP